MKKEKNITKVVVLGNRGVGKTALVVRCITRRFLPEYACLDHAAYTYDTSIEDSFVTMQLIDSQDKDNSAIADAHGAIIVYSVTDPDSFQTIQDYIDRVRYFSRKNATVTVVANKVDLSHKREISTSEGMRLAHDNNAAYVEVSAARDIELISEIFKDVYRNRIDKFDPRISSRFNRSGSISSSSSNGSTGSFVCTPEIRRKRFGSFSGIFKRKGSF